MANQHCKCPEVECEECPEWIFTLADLIMCMMGLFVILWVLKEGGATSAETMTDKEKEVVAAIRDAFGYEPDPTSNDPIDAYIILKRLEQMKSRKGEGEGGETKIRRDGAEGTDPEVTSIRPGKHTTIGGRLLFDRGSVELTPATLNELTEIAKIIRGHRNVIVVKGHTSVDDLPDGAPAERKLDLSIRRAQAVADHLTRAGVDPEILRVQGCSTFEPVAQRAYTEDTRVLNRRVEVTATSALVEDFQDKPKSATTTSSPR